MEKRKAWKLLALLDEHDREDWLAYLAYRFGSNQQYLQQMAGFLTAMYPHPPNSHEVWERLYPEEPYNDARFRKLLGDLTRQLETYLSRRDDKARPIDGHFALLNRLINHAEEDLFSQAWRKASKEIYRQATSAIEIARYRCELEELQREFRLRRRLPEGTFEPQPEQHPWHADDALQRIIYLHSAIHLFQQLSLIIHADNQAKKYGSRPEVPDETEVLDKARHHPVLSRMPLVPLYLRLIDLGRDKIQHIGSLIRYLRRYDHGFPLEERNLLFSALLNHSIRRYNREDDLSAVQDLIDLYEWGISSGALLVEGLLMPTHYKNLIGFYLRVDDVAQAKAKLVQWKDHLAGETKEEVIALNEIYISFAEGDYDHIIKLITRQRFSNILDEIDARSVLWQVHYERDPESKEWLLQQIEQLIRYTRNREGISDLHIQKYLLRFRFFRKLVLVATTEEKQKLLAELADNPTFDRGPWIRKHLADPQLAR